MFTCQCKIRVFLYCVCHGPVANLISSPSLNHGGSRGTTDDVATIPFHPSLSSAALRESSNSMSIYSVFFSVLLLSLSPAELFSQCQRILRCGHTVWVSVPLPWLGNHHVLRLHSGFCCEPPRLPHCLCRKCSESSYSISSQSLDLSLEFCCHGLAPTGTGACKTGLSPPPQYFYTDRSKAVLLLWFLTVLAVCVYTLVHLLC